MEVSQKLKIRLPYDLSISTPEYIQKKKSNTNPKRYMHPMFIAALFTITKIWKPPKYLLTD